MNCFDHQESAAVAQCTDCSKGLCATCASRFTPILCEQCLVVRNRRVARSLWVGLAVSVVIFAAGTAFAITYPRLPVGKAVFSGLLYSFGYWGWKFLSDRFPGMTSGSLVTWVIYVLLKLILSVVIGLVAGPYQIVRTILELRRIRATAAYVAAGPVATVTE